MNIKTITYVLSTTLLLSCTSQNKSNNSPAVSIPVTVTKAQTASSGSFSTTGKVQASQHTKLSTRVMGNIQRIYVAVGDVVKKGQVLLQIDATDLQAKVGQIDAQISRAQSHYTNVKRDYERFQKLYSQKSASQKELDNISTQYQIAIDQLNTAKQQKREILAQFKYTTLRAPYAGTVVSKFVNAGDIAHPGTPLLSIENTDRFEVTTNIPEQYIAFVKKGTTVSIAINALNQQLTGTVEKLSSSSNHNGGQYAATIALPKTNTSLYSGMNATVSFEALDRQENQKSIWIQTAALVRQGQLTGIYTLSQSNTAILRWIRTGKSSHTKTEVLSGLNTEEQYITNSQGKLYNGVPVRIQN